MKAKVLLALILALTNACVVGKQRPAADQGTPEDSGDKDKDGNQGDDSAEQDGSAADADAAQSSDTTSSQWIRVEAGKFVMGSPKSETCRVGNESQHEVSLTRDFEIMRTEVTQAEYEAVTGENPSDSAGCESCPVEQVSWNEAIAFCNNLSSNEDDRCYDCVGSPLRCSPRVLSIYDCEGYRLPTEAEWEYAYRAGTETAYYNGEGPEQCGSCGGNTRASAIAWYCANATNPMEVGTKEANAWGIFDMAGNVYEWTADWYKDDLGSDPQLDPWVDAQTTPSRVVVRGGAWGAWAYRLRAAARRSYDVNRSPLVGFRCARTLP